MNLPWHSFHQSFRVALLRVISSNYIFRFCLSKVANSIATLFLNLYKTSVTSGVSKTLLLHLSKCSSIRALGSVLASVRCGKSKHFTSIGSGTWTLYEIVSLVSYTYPLSRTSIYWYLESIHTECTINLQLESFCCVWVGWQNVGLLPKCASPTANTRPRLPLSFKTWFKLAYCTFKITWYSNMIFYICLYIINTISLTLAYHFLRFCITMIWHDVLLSILKWVDLMVRFWKKQPWWAVCSPCFLGQKWRCVAVIIIVLRS